MFQLNLAISRRMRQVVKISSKYRSHSLTVNDEILTVGYLFVASSQAGLSRPVISIFGAKFPAEIILSENMKILRDMSLVRSDLDIVVCPGMLRRMTGALRSSSS